MPLEPGDEAPDFSLPDQHGERFKLSESIRRTKSSHVIYRYPEETRS